ncbi:DUF3800 domain-containing protein [Fictibacillus enclensis]|uniref:DUF3800 domain-containing protein n=1 Tax=Fictibacillus enclensis TaxID=1017270 RepID=UPI0025A0258C|nr:DUF3800 domain-containing protein [Fictibacillus enclensis]MDM5335720.1 DUF3800 domain-containing protein [Fictibacillus enclensis]
MSQNDVLEQIENEVLEGLEENKKSKDNEISKEKEKERKKKADALWRAVQNRDEKLLTTRVASVLNRYPETRNSDITLQIKYWQVYEGLKSNFVDLTKFYTFERLTSIVRARAKIQNEYKLFLADTETRKRRRTLEEDEKEAQLLDRPSYGIIDVFADETGKTEKFVIVAGIWSLTENIFPKIQRDFNEWYRDKEALGIKLPKEFHFKDLHNKNNQELDLYKEFFNLLIKNGEMVSFKAVAVNKEKLNRMSISDIITSLFYQFIRLGINHELSSNRVKLPQKISLTKDEEEGESAFVLENVKQKLGDNFRVNHGEELVMDQLVSLPSHKHVMLQIADLFVAALNRKYNNPGKNNKDRLAEFILNTTDLKEVKYSAIQVTSDQEENADDIDHSVLFIFD